MRVRKGPRQPRPGPPGDCGHGREQEADRVGVVGAGQAS